MSLITTIAEFKSFIAIDDNTKIKTLQPFIDEAELLYIIPLIGQAFYDYLHPLYLNRAIVPLTPNNIKAVTFIQRSLAYYAQLQSIPQLSLTIGEMGLRTHRSEESDVAPRWKEEKLQLNALKNGDLHADKLLEFLENNATAANEFQTWFASTANTKMSGRLVYSTSIASQFIPINNSRRVFLQLRETIRTIEERHVSKLIGAAQYAELVTQLQTGGAVPTVANLTLISRLQPIIAKRALFMRLAALSISIGQDGVWLYSDVTELRSKDFLATTEAKKELKCMLADGLDGYVSDEEELRRFILDNIANYPLIKTTGIYLVQPDPGPTFQPRNNADNKHFIA